LFSQAGCKNWLHQTYYVREAILKHLNELEEKYLAINRLKKAGKRRAVDEVEKKY